MSKNQKMPSKMYFYEQFADAFDSVVNMYDTTQRIHVVFDDLLTKISLKGKKVLDAGCGTGWFSAEATRRGAAVTALDVGKKLLQQVAKKCECKRVVGSVLALPFKDNTFDIVLSNEVIEHVPDGEKAIAEMLRVLKPGGVLTNTTPNRFWYWSLVIAQALHLRPYQGLENWLTWSQLCRWCKHYGGFVQRKRGVHLFPFVVSLFHPFLKWFDTHGPNGAYPVMVNMAVRVRKQ
jgi:2-polyprenyl-6-hydroxyphenyl methylase/3-demethylubiquinone-9 3-methyltransferase